MNRWLFSLGPLVIGIGHQYMDPEVSLIAIKLHKHFSEEHESLCAVKSGIVLEFIGLIFLLGTQSYAQYR